MLLLVFTISSSNSQCGKKILLRFAISGRDKKLLATPLIAPLAGTQYVMNYKKMSINRTTLYALENHNVAIGGYDILPR